MDQRPCDFTPDEVAQNYPAVYKYLQKMPELLLKGNDFRPDSYHLPAEWPPAHPSEDLLHVSPETDPMSLHTLTAPTAKGDIWPPPSPTQMNEIRQMPHGVTDVHRMEVRRAVRSATNPTLFAAPRYRLMSSARLLIWALLHPRLTWNKYSRETPVLRRQHSQGWSLSAGIRIVKSALDPLHREYNQTFIWRGFVLPYREVAIQMERLLAVDPRMTHPHQAYLFLSQHLHRGPTVLRHAVQRRMDELYQVDASRAEVWGKLRFATLLRIYIHNALINSTVMCQLLDPNITQFLVIAPDDQEAHEMYSNTPGSNAGYSTLLMTARHYVRRILFELRSYAVDPYRLPSLDLQVYLPDSLHDEYRLLYEFHLMYRPCAQLAYPINKRRPLDAPPGSNQCFN